MEAKERLVSLGEADRYQSLFNHMNQEYGLILTIGEMDDIIAEVEKIQSSQRE